MPDHTGRAFGRWIVFSLVFLICGGVGAGVTAFLFKLVIGDPFSDALYAVIFGGCGFIAYRLAKHLHAQRRTPGP